MKTKTALRTLKDACQKYIADTSVTESVLVVGENIDVGSHISGLSLFLKDWECSNLKVINMPNVESITAGIGFGWNLNSGPSFIFVKQLDFLPLYFDDLINTKNMFERLGVIFNVNIISFVVDTRLEGAQSSWRRVDKIGEFLNIDTYAISHVTSVSEIVSAFEKTGLKLFAISQKYGNTILDPDKRIHKVKHRAGDVFDGFEVYSREFDEHPRPMVAAYEAE